MAPDRTGYAKPRPFSEEEIDRRAAQKAETFIGNMGRMSHWCRNHEVLFVPVTHQHTSLYCTGRAGELGNTTYEQECTQVRRAIEQDSGTLNGSEAFLLVHQQLTEWLRHFSAQQALPLADVIDVLDQHRSLMRSRVHLDERANMILATAIAKRIREEIPNRVASRRNGAALIMLMPIDRTFSLPDSHIQETIAYALDTAPLPTSSSHSTHRRNRLETFKNTFCRMALLNASQPPAIFFISAAPVSDVIGTLCERVKLA